MSETGRSAAKKDTNDTADVKELQQAFSLFNDPEVTKLRLADHFPIVLPGCKEQAAKFFHCFTLNSRGQRSTPAGHEDLSETDGRVRHLHKGCFGKKKVKIHFLKSKVR
eukprot:TRINITY_DN3933_c0_g1_i1.p1 TRINITY_DN3933_c0_g1~~TRINITY_DN3933_c0_g1_i1.p1  ORF type:complete len:109 (-),score=32.41 TRINITY_DN3933_c0_g1_i1:52-378(-)